MGCTRPQLGCGSFATLWGFEKVFGTKDKARWEPGFVQNSIY
jgi:hypothetical protein